ncbi:MAG: D-alanyl-D-alanine carboxypeptidase [Alphaproteobacteria bacterium]|nr:D-alanyl-D-alanine carboxypeptidase [Alphaproteobacteria bacterium]
MKYIRGMARSRIGTWRGLQVAAMTRRQSVVLLFITLIFVVLGGAGAELARAERRTVDRQAAFVVDARSGAVLLESDADERRIPASLVKMMTLYLTFEALESGKLQLGQKLAVSGSAADQEPTKLGLVLGQTITTSDAIFGIVTRSANDAAVVLSEALAGSEDRFVTAMNAKARKLGMEHTLYRNASGLPEPLQSTTARDMSILARALIDDFPSYYHYFSTERFRYRNRTYFNHNKLLGAYPGVDGIKTGYTRASGFNIVVSTERGGRRVIVVVMGGDTARDRDTTARAILEGVFSETMVALAEPKKPRAATLVATPRGRMPQTAKREIPPEPALGDGLTLVSAEAREPNNWGIQVGAFRLQASAEKEAKRARSLVSSLKSARITIENATERGKVLFRARLLGLSEVSARTACTALKRKRLVCLPVRPDGETG